MAAPYGNTLVGGGAYIQLQNTARHLGDYGVEADYFDPWKPLDEHDHDLVHIFSAGSATYGLAMRLTERKIPFVVSPVFFTLRKPRIIRLTRWVESFVGNYVRGVWTDYGYISRICHAGNAVLPNTRAEAHLIQTGMNVDERKIHIIPNGVDERFFRADPSLFVEQHGIRDFILYIGNIGSVRKNTLYLIKALKQIDHPAVIIGETLKNSYAEQCLKEAEKVKNLLILNEMPNDSDMLASAYAACKVFTMPSYFETPSIAALEAGLAGAEIVITQFGGTKEYFRDYGYYVDPHSIQSIRKGIESALNAAKNDDLKLHIYNNYLWKRTAEMTAGVYRKVLQ